ncbi:senescence-induced receptor-like serine/threonine-protein kinase, partial [Juglans microcarpa x Juglans regia]|uniref:senescence-induced receptor-like serine/threonine-protein kinase n=1 Tax=Juglans microcarpa x Juglans regia TaxID=2249226 RepID=UPI001B7DDAB8
KHLSEFSYPNDVYDRYWWTEQSESLIPVSSDSTIYTHRTDNAYELPAQVLKTASKARNASIPLQVSWTPLDTLSKFYVYLHFAEIEKLEPGQQRELTIDLNGERNLAESVKLDYLKPLTIVQDDPPISGTGETLYFSIKAAQGTTIPPILNAYEIYRFVELPNKPTAPDDGMLSFFTFLFSLSELYMCCAYVRPELITWAGELVQKVHEMHQYH